MNHLSLPILEFTCFLIILIPALGIYWFKQQHRQQERRRRKLQKIGQKLGVLASGNSTTVSTLQPDVFAHCLPFSPKASFFSLLNGRHEQLAFDLFDYGYTAEDGAEMRQTVLVCQMHQPAPAFLVRPQNLATLFKTPQLYRLIHLPVLTAYDYTLSMGYETDDTAVEMVKRLPANTWPLLRERGALLACNGEQMVYYRHGCLLTAEQTAVEAFLSEGLALAAVMISHS